MSRTVFVCDDCPKRFPRLDSLRRHKTEVHGPKLACSTCKQEFSRLSTLRNHVLRIHESVTSNNNNEIIPQSVIKTASSKNKMTLKNRVLDKRESQGNRKQQPDALNSKKFVCQICQNRFSAKESLRRHIREIHGCKQPANQYCGVCNKYFQRKDYFRIHMRQHHGPIAEREKFHCKVCNVFFTWPCTFHRHNRVFHSIPKQISEKISRVGYSKTVNAYKKTSPKMSFRKQNDVIEAPTSPEKSKKKGVISRPRGKAKSNSMIWMCPCDRVHHSKKAYLLHAVNYHQDIYNAIRKELYPDDPQPDLEF